MITAPLTYYVLKYALSSSCIKTRLYRFLRPSVTIECVMFRVASLRKKKTISYVYNICFSKLQFGFVATADTVYLYFNFCPALKIYTYSTNALVYTVNKHRNY